MLENTITLSLNNGGTPVDAEFKRIDVFVNRSVYHGPTHTNVDRETIGFYRTPAKKSGNFLGVMKSAAKVTKDLSVLNFIGETTVQPAIGEISFSVPVGASEEEADDLFDYMEALIKDKREILKRTLFGPEI